MGKQVKKGEKSVRIAEEDIEKAVEWQRKRKIEASEGSESDASEGSDADISSDEEIAEIGRQNEVDKKIQRQNKRIRNNDDGSESFSKAMNSLLDTHLKAYDREDPILAKSKGQIKRFENEKLELKAKRLLLAKKREKLTSGRRKQLIPGGEDEVARDAINRERKLRKVAQRGVIKLFNAILVTQTGEQEIGGRDGVRRRDEVTEVSKEKFLDMVQRAK
ncbi:DEKNAAC105463 [Brettanomyces naardenensis]|uniref:DEKNAAC105463 n=1 Tax=Brettanomyces naardenensis TaxID=13370 RepID=A0A448YTE0_BRENA|nr:DEKNAAC105463 [Brettanomyces naardenensis]